MPKKICSYNRKDIKQNKDDLAEIVGNGKYICKKCARSACDKGYLCEPDKLKSKGKKLLKKNKKSNKSDECNCATDKMSI